MSFSCAHTVVPLSLIKAWSLVTEGIQAYEAAVTQVIVVSDDTTRLEKSRLVPSLSAVYIQSGYIIISNLNDVQ